MNPDENINYTSESVENNNGNKNVKTLLFVLAIASFAFLLFRKRQIGQANQTVTLPNNIPTTNLNPNTHTNTHTNTNRGFTPKYFSVQEIGKGKALTISVKNNITELIKRVLDPLRSAYGKPIVIEKGYNPYWQNLSYLPTITRYMKSDFGTGRGVEIRPLANHRNDLKKLIQIAVQQRNFDKIVVERNSIYISFSAVVNSGTIYKYNGANQYTNITNNWQQMI